MTYARISMIAFACALCAIGGCSKTAPGSSAAPATTTAAQPLTEKSGSACDRKLLTPEDAAGILGQPVVESKNIPGDPQSCKFSSAGYSSLTISVRPGHGNAAVGMYTSGKMDEFDKSAPLAGVGDEAVRSLSLHRVIARKGDLLCEITGPGLANQENDPMPQKLGALCNKIFAAY